MAANDSAGRVRVLLVDLASEAWGAERVALQLAPRLHDLGIDVVLASPAGEFSRQWTALGLAHHRLDGPTHGSIRTSSGGRSPLVLAREAAVGVRAAARMRRLARTVDLLHSNHLYSHVEVTLGARAARRPVLVHVHDFVRPGAGQRLLRLTGRLASAVAVTSAAVATRVGFGAGTRVEVVHPALDTDAFSPGPADPRVRDELGADRPDHVLIGVLGRLDHVKGVDVAIRACANLDSAARLAVVGAPLEATAEDVAALERLGKDELGERVRFLPARTDVVPVLRAIDILASPARDEPFGASVLEAQACARPVVVSDVGGHGEHVLDGRTGLVVPPEDPVRLHDALARLVADDALRARLGEESREMVVREHDVAAAAVRLAALYRDLVGGRR